MTDLFRLSHILWFLVHLLLIVSIDCKPSGKNNKTLKSSSDEKFALHQKKLEEKLALHEKKMKEIQEKINQRAEKRRRKLIKKGKITTKFWLDDLNDPDYFLRTRPKTSQEIRHAEKMNAKFKVLRDEFYNDHEKWPTPESEPRPEIFSGVDESKEMTFFEKVYGWTKYPQSTTIYTDYDHVIHPYDNPQHPHYHNTKHAYKQHFKYNSEEINHYNRQLNLTLSKHMFTPLRPYVTGTNLSDWLNVKNNSDRWKAFYYPIDPILKPITAHYMKYVFTPLVSKYPGHDELLERIEHNLKIPQYDDHIKNSTWCFICGDTFSHPQDRASHVTFLHHVNGDYGQDRLSDPNWEWKEDIQIYRRPTFHHSSEYVAYVHPDDITFVESMDHYEYWNKKREAGEITFPNRPENRNRTKPPIDRKRYLKILDELKCLAWRPTKEPVTTE